jgi:hypothetical protein
MALTLELASRFAKSTLGHVDQEYPHGLGHFMTGPETITPSGLHPIFYGSFDWHSCVHGWWQLFRIASLFPELSPEILSKASVTFTAESVAKELAYLEANPGFERPYGWGWFLALHTESGPYQNVLAPMAALISSRFHSYLPRLTYPVRAGTHANTAFASILAHDWAVQHDADLASCISAWSKRSFGHDVAAPLIEPSGEDFLSPTLTEAVMMSRVLSANEFRAWIKQFMPVIASNLLEPVVVSDRSDGRIGHLDGLNLSRAWCWRTLGLKVPEVSLAANESATRHLEAALPHLEANYMSEHWLCSFALLALS